MVSSISLKPYAKFPLPLSFSILPPSLLHSSWLLAFTVCPWRGRSYYPCRWERKGCYSLVTLSGSGRFWGLMYSLHWRKAAETPWVRAVRPVYLRHQHHLLDSEWHSTSPGSPTNSRCKRCTGRPAPVGRHHDTCRRRDWEPLHLGHNNKCKSLRAKSFRITPSLLFKALRLN